MHHRLAKSLPDLITLKKKPGHQAPVKEGDLR
jgi:hypothetical protein